MSDTDNLQRSPGACTQASADRISMQSLEGYLRKVNLLDSVLGGRKTPTKSTASLPAGGVHKSPGEKTLLDSTHTQRLESLIDSTLQEAKLKKQEHSHLEADISLLKKEIKSLEEENRNETAAMKETRKRLASAADREDAQTKSNDNLLRVVRLLEEKIASKRAAIQRDLYDSQLRSDRLNAELERARREMENANADARKERDILEAEMKGLEQELDTVRDKIGETDRAIVHESVVEYARTKMIREKAVRLQKILAGEETLLGEEKKIGAAESRVEEGQRLQSAE